MLRRVLFGLLFACFSYSQAVAATLSEFIVENWLGFAFSNDQSGDFSHCAIVSDYQSGITLVFSIDRNYQIRVSMSKDVWQLSPGQTYPVALWIDNGRKQYMQAVATSQEQVSISLDNAAQYFDAFRRGHVLYVQTKSSIFNFNLDGTFSALTSSLGCVTQQLAAETTNNNPFAGKNPFGANNTSRNTTSVDRSLQQAEATLLIANVLSNSKVTGYKLIPHNELPETLKQFDAVWITEDLFGAVTVIDDNNGSSIEDALALILAYDARVCEGKFVSAKLPGNRANGSSRIMTECSADGNESEGWRNHYILISKNGGGFYNLVFSATPSTSDLQEDKEYLNDLDGIQNAALRYISNE